jgi:DNA-binding transcriptional ArsR family regulator
MVSGRVGTLGAWSDTLGAVDDDLLRDLEALADVSRIRILGRLATQPAGLDALAGELRLSRSAVTHGLERLKEAGLIEAAAAGGAGSTAEVGSTAVVGSTHARRPTVWKARPDRLMALGRRLEALRGSAPTTPDLTGPDGEPVAADVAKVLRAFVVDGRLVSIPAVEKKREPVLDWVLRTCFADDRDYPEKEVNARLAELHQDTASLRRYLVDTGRMTRAGGIYRRA